ncbi:hypothetical protein, partial [Bradyrhizobium retamae]|uniref:hypothetical protein n=1 Tax=Bradyrhizobium retamae TaxID=1300035 RepID=UPI001AECE00F
KGQRRMGAHLHRSQPRQAGEGRMSRYHSDKTGFPMLTGQAPSVHSARLYERMAWKIMGEVQVGSSPPVFPILRHPY